MHVGRTMARTHTLGVVALVAAAWLAPCRAADEPASEPCCEADVTLRAVSDRVTFSSGPLLKPRDQGRADTLSQVRAEFALRGPVGQPDAPLKWSLRAYARSSQVLGLLDAESPALIKLRQASVSVPVLEGDVTVGRIVAGSGTLRTRNLVDYLDEVSVHTETRSGFLPERLENRIGQVGVQVSQIVGALGAVQWLLVKHSNEFSDSNSRSFSLLRVAPAIESGSASLEGLWYWSRERTAAGLQGSVAAGASVQFYGELSYERQWPLLEASTRGVEVKRVHAMLFGAGVEYKPAADWTTALEFLHNDHPVDQATFNDSARYLATATLVNVLSATAKLRSLPYGYQQPWYAGALLQYQWPEQKLTVAASHYRGLRDGSSLSTLQLKLGLGKHAELSLFARSTHAGTGQELQFTPEARRFGAAANFVF
jgi:hypothetical protein